MTREEKFMNEAIRIGMEGMQNNFGGPFGCVVVKNNEIIGRGCNSVIITNDPTAHAEVVAIREACKKLESFQLNDCEIYTTCEPCPCVWVLFIGPALQKFILQIQEQMRPILALMILLFMKKLRLQLMKEK